MESLAPNLPHEAACEWLRAHEALSRLAKARAELDWEEGRWMLSALRCRAHAHLGFGSFHEYIERLFGYKPRSTEEKLRVAVALEHLPELEQALKSAGFPGLPCESSRAWRRPKTSGDGSKPRTARA